MKTIFAIICYCVAIAFLVACTGVIVAKLLLWPPCTQIGNTCVIEPWSAAGVTSTVLGVAATVLAIIGAVVVAAWWLSLNKIVTGRVKKLYKQQSEASIARYDQLLRDQQERVNLQLREYQVTFDQLHLETEKLKNSLEVVHESTTFLLAEQKQLYKSDTRIVELLAKFLEGVQRGDFAITQTNHDTQHEA